jgi:2-methylcitrate dehydratase PrpD
VNFPVLLGAALPSLKGSPITIARSLAEFIVETDFDDLPVQTTEHAAMMIASTLASAAVGYGITSTKIIRNLEKERGGVADSTVWFDGGTRLPVIGAARSNALASDAAASDDSDLRNITHAGTPMTSATLAVAEKNGATGKDVLAAIVLGYEAAGRIGASVTPTFKERGFHASLIAIFSGAVAASKLFRADVDQMANTLALAATSMGGLVAAAMETVTREYHAGLATMLGLEAAYAAYGGFEGEQRIFEIPGGFCAVHGNGNAEEIVENFGAEWDIVTDMSIKLVPGSQMYHSMAEAAANAARKGDVSPEQVSAIILSSPGTNSLRGPRHPHNLVDMAHSAAYFLAAGTADRDFSWAHATQEKIDDPVIHELIDKVEMGPEPTENREKYRQGATVTIKTMDGQAWTETVFVPNGAGCRGIDWGDIEKKYRALTPSALGPEKIDESFNVIRRFDEVSNVSELTGLLI